MNNPETNLSDLLASRCDTEHGSSYQIAPSWMQGRTTYGGLSAALCLDHTLHHYDNLPPLRSAAVTFIGPASDQVVASSELLRQGKSVSYIRSSLRHTGNIATDSVFCFGAARESKLDTLLVPAPDVPTVDVCDDFFVGDQRPLFSYHFEVKMASGDTPFSGAKNADMTMWIRHKQHALYQQENLNDYVSLIAIADMPPPAIVPLFKGFAPISSMNWHLNFVSAPTTGADGWWLLQTKAESASEGYSSQDMFIWNSEGRLVVTARQNVAAFY